MEENTNQNNEVNHNDLPEASLGSPQGTAPKRNGLKVFVLFTVVFLLITSLIFTILYAFSLYTKRAGDGTEVNDTLIIKDNVSESTDTSMEQPIPQDADEDMIIQTEIDAMDSMNISDFENDYRDTTLNDLE